ncbi:hypothetical protein T4A_2283 [Trichinella pseudospiralis]|uniref:Uncharacterized protein n=1 Tax=Trichinella pseudospiralis TaxID=6337 RepID=A0A0V1EIF9_TRIPS|nr:hypothetical protein T4A_2283 [Trichinella pseudospiralis]
MSTLKVMTLSCTTQKIVKAKHVIVNAHQRIVQSAKEEEEEEAEAEEELDEEEEEEEEEEEDDDDDDDEVALMLYGGFKLRAAEPLILHACMENESHKFHNLPIQYCLCVNFSRKMKVLVICFDTMKS